MFAKPLNPLGTRDVRDPGPGNRHRSSEEADT